MLIRSSVLLLFCVVMILAPYGASAANAPSATSARDAPLVATAAAAPETESPWLVLPTLSSNPKLGTSLGALTAYLHYFDEKSQVSMFGASAQYTSTDSVVGAIFAKTSSGADHHRLIALAAGGVSGQCCVAADGRNQQTLAVVADIELPRCPGE